MRGVQKRGWGVWAAGRPRSRLLRLLWVFTPSPSHPPSLPPLFRPPPVAPRAILLPSVGIGGFPAALAQGAVALRDVLVSGGPGVSAEAREGEEAAARGTRERKIHREMLVISLRRRF